MHNTSVHASRGDPADMELRSRTAQTATAASKGALMSQTSSRSSRFEYLGYHFMAQATELPPQGTIWRRFRGTFAIGKGTDAAHAPERDTGRVFDSAAHALNVAQVQAKLFVDSLPPRDTHAGASPGPTSMTDA